MWLRMTSESILLKVLLNSFLYLVVEAPSLYCFKVRSDKF